MSQFGFRMQPIPFYAGMYLVNHGEYMQERCGVFERKLNYIDENKICDEARSRQIEQEFFTSVGPSQ